MPRRGLEIACTGTPAASSCDTTSFQPELSAKAPWTRATVMPDPLAELVPVMGILLVDVRGRRRSALQEGEQVGVELLLVGAGEPVRGSRVDLERPVLHQLDRLLGRGHDRDDLVVVAVRDQGGDVDGLEVLAGVGLREGLDAVVGALDPDGHRLQPELVALALRHRRAGPVGAVEGRREVLVELRAVAGY